MNSKTNARTGTVLAVGIIAAVQSYSHIYSLALANMPAGPTRGLDAALLPLSVDGMIIAASQALTSGAAHVLARWVLALGVTATVGANVAYGLSAGPLSAVLCAWPGIGFVASAELLLMGGRVRKVRVRRRQRPASIPVRPSPIPLHEPAIPPAVPPAVPLAEPAIPPAIPPAVPPAIPSEEPAIPLDGPAIPRDEAAGRSRIPLADRVASAQLVFAGDLVAGRVPGIGAIRDRVGGSQPTAYEVQRELRKRAKAAA